MSDEPRLRVGERAQLLLVGAVAVALIILGLVVVYNTILFTNTQEPTQSLDDTAEANRLQAQIVNDTQKLVNYINNDTGNNCSKPNGPDADLLESDIKQNLTNASNGGNKSLAKGLTYSNAKTGVKFVNITNVETTPSNKAGCKYAKSGKVRVKLTVVVKTPETDYRTRINESYDPEP